MNLHPQSIENEIKVLIANCCKKPFRSKESIAALKEQYDILLRLRSKIILQCTDFPCDRGTEAITNLLDGIIQDKMDAKKMEWIYDHYTDLFKFKAEELLLQTSEKLAGIEDAKMNC